MSVESPTNQLPSLSWDQFRARVNELAKSRGEWAGYPMPVEGHRLVLEPRYPLQSMQGYAMPHSDAVEEAQRKLRGEVSGECHLINTWFSWELSSRVYVWHNGDGRSKVTRIPEFGQCRLTMAIDTMACSSAWSVNAEVQAIETLNSMISPAAARYYFLTGMFMESSKRSGIFYVFRKCRPTIALSANDERGMKVLTALCLHPIGFYDGTFAGTMVPTDDVIAHLLMMRGNEPKFWAKANHHPVYALEAGL